MAYNRQPQPGGLKEPNLPAVTEQTWKWVVPLSSGSNSTNVKDPKAENAGRSGLDSRFTETQAIN